nr:MAG TPA: Protein of unknown function (DUF1360) [Caudoviricetes sp.]
MNLVNDIDMLNIVGLVFMIAMISCFIFLFLDKIGFRGYIVMYSPIRLFSDLFNCDFCLSFWINLFVSMLVVIVTQDYWTFLIPLFSTPISRKFL